MIGPRRGHRRDAGVTTEVLIYPVLLTLVMVVFQFALHAHAQQLVSAAAEDAADRVRVQGGTATEGETTAYQLLAEQAPGLLANETVAVIPLADRVRVEVRGDVISLVPFVDLAVIAVEEGPIERFVSQPDR